MPFLELKYKFAKIIFIKDLFSNKYIFFLNKKQILKNCRFDINQPTNKDK